MARKERATCPICHERTELEQRPWPDPNEPGERRKREHFVAHLPPIGSDPDPEDRLGLYCLGTGWVVEDEDRRR